MAYWGSRSLSVQVRQTSPGRVKHARLNETERYNLLQAYSEIDRLPLYIDDRSYTLSAIARGVRRMPSKPQVVIVDHLHLMRTQGRQENRNTELSTITRELKLLAGELNCTVLLLAQLNRSSEKENRPPEMRDLRESGSIEADADVIIFLHRKQQMTEGDRKTPVPVDMLLVKQRDGASHIRIPMLLIGHYYQFREAERKE